MTLGTKSVGICICEIDQEGSAWQWGKVVLYGEVHGRFQGLAIPLQQLNVTGPLSAAREDRDTGLRSSSVCDSEPDGKTKYAASILNPLSPSLRTIPSSHSPPPLLGEKFYFSPHRRTLTQTAAGKWASLAKPALRAPAMLIWICSERHGLADTSSLGGIHFSKSFYYCCMGVRFAYVCNGAPPTGSACRGQKVVLDPLRLGLKTAVSYRMVSGIQT